MGGMCKFSVIENDKHKCAVLSVKSNVLIVLASAIESSGMSQSEAASLIGVHQPRISDLMSGKVDKFSLDSLIEMASRFGVDVSFDVSREGEKMVTSLSVCE